MEHRVKTASLIIRLLLFSSFSQQTESYFSFQDCSYDCQLENRPCLIYKLNEHSVFIQCIENGGSCRSEATENIPCISRDEPTVGGQNLWPWYNNLPKPQPKPASKQNCTSWKIVTLINSLLSFTVWTALGLNKLINYRKRGRYQRLPSLIEDNPYRPTTMDIDSPADALQEHQTRTEAAAVQQTSDDDVAQTRHTDDPGEKPLQ
jgi:hypothetical protein